MAVRKIGERWYYDFMIRRVRYRGVIPEACTKKQALKAEDKIRVSIYEGKYENQKGTITLKEFVEKRYIPWTKANKRSWKIDMSRVKPILASFGNRRMCDISPFLVEKFKIQRKNTPVITKTKQKQRSIGAINRELRLLSRIFKLAVDSNDLAENPCKKVGILKGEQFRTRFLLPDEEERMMAQLPDHLKDMVVLVINTGLRVSEVFNLKPEHVDFHRDVIYIKGTKTDEDRDVPLNDVSRELLQKLMGRAKDLGNQFIFTNPQTKTKYTTIKTAWRTACERAGIKDLRFHDLRHTFGTRAADAGVPLNAIRDVMGHKSTTMTERYAHATDEGKRRAV